MDEELELDLAPEEQNINKTEERIKNLSSKVREKANEAEAARKATEEANAAREAAEKKAEFLESFSEVASKYQGAGEHKADIEAKVQAGYSVEDATVAVLVAQGKFQPQAEAVTQPNIQAAGGSATIDIPSTADKSIEEMSHEEKRNALIEADRAGELRKILRY